MSSPDILAIVRNFFGSGYPTVKVLAKDPTTRQPLYIAIGTRGATEASANWKVFKLTYDNEGDFQMSQTSEENVAAASYLTLEYK